MPTGVAAWLSGRLPDVRRWYERAKPAWDRWMALIFAVLGFVPALAAVGVELGDLPRRPIDALGVMLLLGQALPLAFRSRWPVPTLAVIAGFFSVYEALGYRPTFAGIALYVGLYSVGANQERFRRTIAAAATAAYLALSILLTVLGSPDRPLDFFIFYLALGIFVGVGAYVRRRRIEEIARREREALAATTAERARIARELHDVVTHHVTSMVVQADATQFLTDSPDRVTDGLGAISGAGRRALSELRYLLGVLEATGESADPKAASSLGTFADLVAQTKMGGQPVELVEQGERPGLAVAVELAAYRVVQEALTNAVKYAAGRRTVVRVEYRAEEIEIVVDSVSAVAPVPAAAGGAAGEIDVPGGRGLTGLRERVGKLGGQLTAGPRDSGSFRVRALIPLGDKA